MSPTSTTPLAAHREFLSMIARRSTGTFERFEPGEATGWTDCESDEPWICRRAWGEIVLDGCSVGAAWNSDPEEGHLFRTDLGTPLVAYMVAVAASRCHGSELEPLLGEPVGELP